jgi:hypothetical protein
MNNPSTRSNQTMTSTIATSLSAAPQRGNLDDTDYRSFRLRVAARFDGHALNGPLFTTDVDPWPIYIDAFPAEARQFHNCTACRHFLRAFGGLAVIGEHGQVIPALWHASDADADHATPVAAMAAAIRRARITGVFLTSTAYLGTEFTGAWAHLAVRLPSSSPAWHRGGALTASQKIAERTQDHGNVMRALAEFPLEQLERVVELLKTDALYRAEKVLGPAEWLRDLAAAVTKGDRRNLVWRAIATAPAGFCHPRSSMAGTLLEDLAGGMSFDAAAARFRTKMHPLQYQRPTAPPSTGQIAAAERLVEQLGIARSLPRRFARIEDLETLWRPAPTEPTATGSVFGHLRPATSKDQPLDVTEQRITWERFARTVLPDATALEALLPARGNYCALVTAVDPDAPPILQWDRPERRNPVSWYVYPAGSEARQWALTGGTWRAVTALTLQPSMWGDAPLAHQGRSAIAIVAGARDTRWQTAGGGLFPEILRSELHGARATIEAYSQRATIAGFDQATACGLRIGDKSEAVLRATTRTGSRFVYRIDRWD